MTVPVFSPDFAAYYQWAEMYRACGLQVIPAYSPDEAPKQWKRPKLAEWVPLQGELAPQFTWDRWYGVDGEHVSRRNMGILTGQCSGNVWVLDLDTQKTPQASVWWQALLAIENNCIEPETVQQVTGGGGRQLLFRAPPGVVMPTCKTARGVDVRGQGGFAMMPPSMHESGHEYEWVVGCAPWEIEIATAPQWLIDAVFDLVDDHSAAQGERTPDPATTTNEFGSVIDGREQVMRDVVWHAVLELYRASPILPSERIVQECYEQAYLRYEGLVGGRGPIADRTSALEADGRGPTEFRRKLARAMKQWGSPRMAEAAGRPNPKAATPGGLHLGAQNAALNTTPTTGANSPGIGTPLVLTSAEFIAGFSPPAYVIDGILQRGYLYAMTARTGHGKTALCMYMAQCIARGEPMHGHPVKAGTVLMLAGENPDDIRARFLVLAESYGFDPAAVKIRFIAGVVNITARMGEIRAAADAIDDLIMVMVDTAAAYFPGDETNSNSQQGAYARVLRELTFLNGKPTVLVNCHPIKNAGRDNLIPMGGSAFINEVDGNLTLWASNERQVALHWQGKFRGPEFDPIAFELTVASSPLVKDAEGRLMPSVIAQPISELTLEANEQIAESDEDKILKLIHGHPKASWTNLAQLAGFSETSGKSRVQRIIDRLKDDKMVVRYRGGKYQLTPKGEEAIGVGGGDDD